MFLLIITQDRVPRASRLLETLMELLRAALGQFPADGSKTTLSFLAAVGHCIHHDDTAEKQAVIISQVFKENWGCGAVKALKQVS